MNRRRYILAAGTALFSGCSSDSESDFTPTETATPTPTPTPEITQFRGLVDKPENIAEQYKESENKSVLYTTGFAKGAPKYFGFEADIPVHNGAYQWSAKVTIYGNDGVHNEYTVNFDKSIVSGSGPVQDSGWIELDSDSDISLGTQSAKLIVRDNISGETTETTLNVEITEPLGPEECTVADSEIPTFVVGQRDEYTITFANLTNRPSSLLTTLSGSYESTNQWQETDNRVELNIAPNGQRILKNTVSYENARNLQIRFDAIDEVVTIPIEEN